MRYMQAAEFGGSWAKFLKQKETDGQVLQYAILRWIQCSIANLLYWGL
jgi:hypothetical protein